MNKYLLHLPTGYKIEMPEKDWPKDLQLVLDTEQFYVDYSNDRTSLYESDWRYLLINISNMSYELYGTQHLITYTGTVDWFMSHLSEFELVYVTEEG